MRTQKKKAWGITLVELLVILAIVSIGMMIAVPSFKAMSTRNRVATDVNRFLLAINLARSEASRTGSTVSVVARPGAQTSGTNEFGGGWCVVLGAAADCSGTVVRQFDGLRDGIVLNSLEGDSRLSFNSLGAFTDSTPRRVDLCVIDSDVTVSGRHIYITPIGRSKSYKPDDLDVNRRPICPPA